MRRPHWPRLHDRRALISIVAVTAVIATLIVAAADNGPRTTAARSTAPGAVAPNSATSDPAALGAAASSTAASAPALSSTAAVGTPASVAAATGAASGGASPGPALSVAAASRAAGSGNTGPGAEAAPLAVAPQTPTPACQGTTPLGLSGNWTCTFDDEFNGSSLNTSTWVPQVSAASGYLNGESACYVDSPDTISVSGGYLHLTALQVAPFTCSYGSGDFTTSYEAGMVSTYGLFDQTYGAFEVSAKLPPAVITGLQETMWLYPQNLTYGAWPDSGEIDFAEFYSNFPGLDVPYIHYSQSSTDLNATAFDCFINQDAFNTYGVDWTPTSITVLDNGQPCLVDHPTTGSQPFDQPFFIALTQALGVGTDAFVPGTTPLPATTEVDWVRAWTPAS
jgi:beta-glucanase (GH16 family)